MTKTGVLAAIALLLPIVSPAQDQPAPAFAYVTYFVCDPSVESRADEIIKRNYLPHYDAAVEHADIASWSWLVHYVGGEWRRALVLTATNMDNLLDASGALGEIIEESTPEAGRVFTEVCDEHVDYIWRSTPGVDGGSAGDARGDVGFSTYMVCELDREDRADEIMRENYAPLYNRHVADGGIASWTWLQHEVGGVFRRLLAVTASDHKTLMRTQMKIRDELADRRMRKVTEEFNQICHTHEDYMWDVQMETP